MRKAMITGKLRKSGNSFIVTVPRDEIERLGLSEGQLVTVEVRPAEVRPVLAADLREAFQIEFRNGREALQYLAQ
jgi:antitoxin component of MazEF toxin-antitoxin module